MSNELKFELSVPESLNPQGVKIRTAGTPEGPLFCLADVCAVLGIDNVGNVAERLDDDEKSYIRRADVGLAPGRDIVFATESGLYTVLLRSDKPQAKPFRKWVTGEVLPSIRKYGCYPAPENIPVAEPVASLSPAQVLLAMAQRLYDQEQALLALHAEQARQQEAIADVEHLAQAALDCQQHNYGCYSALAYLKIHKKEVTLPEASKLGIRASRLCRERGIAVSKVRDPRFGEVNIYPESILDEAAQVFQMISASRN